MLIGVGIVASRFPALRKFQRRKKKRDQFLTGKLLVFRDCSTRELAIGDDSVRKKESQSRSYLG